MALLQTPDVGDVGEDAALASLLHELNTMLAPSDERFLRRFTGQDGSRQPLHSVYIPADEYSPDLPVRWGAMAIDTLDRVVATPSRLASIVGTGEDHAERLFQAVRRKLSYEPVEDLRLDFEDGLRTHTSEDAVVAQALDRLDEARANDTLPASVGIRFKSLEPATRERGLRTLMRFIEGVAPAPELIARLRLTLPKVTSPEQVSAMAQVCDRLERLHGLPELTFKFEIQIETPQSIILSDGGAAPARLIDLAQGRCNGLHFGAYDYTAACGIVAKYQGVAHPSSEYAKLLMQVAAAGTPVRVSDGATIHMPVGSDLEVEDALRHHAGIVGRALERGIYQGWDMHPAQLITRFASAFAFYLDGFDEAAQRLHRYLSDRDSSADEPASIRALAAHVSRAIQCGAVTGDEAYAATGISPADLHILAAA
ncbi:DUF6986 family protein [Paenarthrobacter ureafaciens]|uniref:DUF6986 family protein n=1 Tax=Paenarthrobacter ureafaciens TaxID=37931 RepID=UPI0019177E50|nr:aldolase/citrate lyase family protein [Paenarthrobacter ureafaciens]QQQ64358.1 aldolase [Paenarthrobacter ureafaciens]